MAGRVHVTARQQADPLCFETALQALARELDDPATPLINYQKRRKALENWYIDEDDWAVLAERLPPRPRHATTGLRGLPAPGRFHLRLGPAHLRRAHPGPQAYRSRSATRDPGNLETQTAEHHLGPNAQVPSKSPLFQPQGRTRHSRNFACPDYRFRATRVTTDMC